MNKVLNARSNHFYKASAISAGPNPKSESITKLNWRAKYKTSIEKEHKKLFIQ